MIDFIETNPQKSDMGNSYGYAVFDENMTLDTCLDEIKQKIITWGTITIIRHNEVLRCFDYDMWNSKYFYYNIPFSKIYKVEQISYTSCWMNKDITIILK